MDEMQSLERRAGVAMKHVELNMKKIRQQLLMDGTWDTQRLQATTRILTELCGIAETIDMLWEAPAVKQIAHR